MLTLLSHLTYGALIVAYLGIGFLTLPTIVRNYPGTFLSKDTALTIIAGLFCLLLYPLMLFGMRLSRIAKNEIEIRSLAGEDTFNPVFIEHKQLSARFDHLTKKLDELKSKGGTSDYSPEGMAIKEEMKTNAAFSKALAARL